MEESVLIKAHPVMFRNNPLLFIFGFAAIPFFGVGLLLFLAWWLDILGKTLIVTDKRTIYRRGIISRYTCEVVHSNIRNVEVKQTALERLMGVGSIGIASAGRSGIEIKVSGVRNPYKVTGLIDKYRDL